MKIFYRDEQTAKKNSSFSPSAGKPALVVESWKRSHPDAQVVSFEPVTRAELYKVHAPEYVDSVLDGHASNGFGNKLGEVAYALPYVAGSMVAATLHAYKTGETSFSPTSGAHHACYDHGGGYCTFNFLVLAAVMAHEAGAERVGIADLDAHGGNGVVDIIDVLCLHYIDYYSYGYDQTRPHRQQFVSGITDWADRAVAMIETMNNEQWLNVFSMRMQDMARNCDIILYNAGMDASENDPLCGGRGLSDAELESRDNIVFRAARQHGKPVVVSLAGGYQEPVSKVVALHNITYKAALLWEHL